MVNHYFSYPIYYDSLAQLNSGNAPRGGFGIGPMAYQNPGKSQRPRNESQISPQQGDEEGLDEQIKLEDYLGVDEEEDGLIPEVIDVENVKILVGDEDVASIE